MAKKHLEAAKTHAEITRISEEEIQQYIQQTGCSRGHAIVELTKWK